MGTEGSADEPVLLLLLLLVVVVGVVPLADSVDLGLGDAGIFSFLKISTNCWMRLSLSTAMQRWGVLPSRAMDSSCQREYTLGMWVDSRPLS